MFARNAEALNITIPNEQLIFLKKVVEKML